MIEAVCFYYMIHKVSMSLLSISRVAPSNKYHVCAPSTSHCSHSATCDNMSYWMQWVA